FDPSSSPGSSEPRIDHHTAMPPESSPVPAASSFPAPSSSFATAPSSPDPGPKPDDHSDPAPKSSADGSGSTPASSAHGSNRQIAGPPPKAPVEDASEEDA